MMFINSATDPHFESVERSPLMIYILSQLNKAHHCSTFWVSWTKSDTDLCSESIERSSPLIPILSQLNHTIYPCFLPVQQSPPLIHILSQLKPDTDPYSEPIKSHQWSMFWVSSESVEQSPPLVSLLRQCIQSATDPYFELIESSP